MIGIDRNAGSALIGRVAVLTSAAPVFPLFGAASVDRDNFSREQHGTGSGTPFARRAFYVNQWRCTMFKSLDIQRDMEVVGLDGKHVGIVDHLETADRIILSKDDPKAGGRQHLISIDWVDYVDQKVHLNKPSTKATSEWQTAA
jgi:hypothetical protein